jgi:hypothetical protein
MMSSKSDASQGRAFRLCAESGKTRSLRSLLGKADGEPLASARVFRSVLLAL